MIKATKNGDLSTKNVVNEYSRLIDNYISRFVDEYSGSNLQIYNMYDKLWGPSQREVTLFLFLIPSIQYMALNTFDYYCRLEGHSDSVTCMASEQKILFSGSDDAKII